MVPTLKEVTVRIHSDSIVISPVWDSVDRLDSPVIAIPNGEWELAARLKAAILSGKCWSKQPEVLADIYGETYVSADLDVSTHSVNADLKKIGF